MTAAEALISSRDAERPTINRIIGEAAKDGLRSVTLIDRKLSGETLSSLWEDGYEISFLPGGLRISWGGHQ